MTITTPTQKQSQITANKIIGGIAQVEWREMGNDGEPPAIPTPEDLSKKVKSLEWQPPQAFLTALPPEEYPSLPQDPEPPGDAENAWYRFNRCYLSHAKSYPSNIYQVLENRQNDPLDTEVIDQSEYCDAKTGETIVVTVVESTPLPPAENHEQTRARNTATLEMAHFLWGSVRDDNIEFLHTFWLQCEDNDSSLRHPLAPIIRTWLKEQEKRKGSHPIRDATIDQANGFTTIGYAASEVTRRQWEAIGSIDTVMVDGEPIASLIADIDNFSVEYPQAYKPKGTEGQLKLALPKGRDTMSVPITLIAYQMFGSDLRSALAPDVTLLMQIAYAANEKLILNVKDGAALLSRDMEGNPRYPRLTDEKRFESAFACLHGMAGWITDDRDIPRFYPLTACDRISNDEVIISAPAWARREKGRWTLTATLGEAGRLRFKGSVHNNNIKRVVDGIEYWLARDRHAHGGISQSLLPAYKNTGPGPWQTLKWDKLLMLAGDIWDTADKQANRRAYKRFDKIRSTLIEYGYQVSHLNRPAPAGDSVEFLFGGKKDGKLQVRASDRFVEAARQAQRKKFSRIPLNELLRL